MNPVALLLLLFFSSVSLAATDTQIGKTYHQAVPNVQQTLEKSLNNLSHLPIKAADYCKDATCKKDIAAPSLSHYLNDSTALTQDSQRQLATDPNASNITSGFNHRPKRPVNPNDPAYQNAKKYMDNSYNISHGLSNKYIDCEKGQVCESAATTQQCSEPTQQPVFCEVIAYPVNVNIVNTQHVIPVNGMFGVLPLPRSMQVSRIDLPAIRRAPHIFQGNCSNNTRVVTVDIYINGEKVKSVKGTFDLLNLGVTCRVSLAMPATTLDFSPHKTLSSILIDFSQVHNDNMIAHGNIVVHNRQENTEMGWRDNCSSLPRTCQQTQEVCVEGAGTRFIHGVAIYQACWKKRRTMQCHYPNTCAPLLTPPTEAAPRQCAVTSKRCKTQLLGVCIESTVNLACEERTCKKTNLQCGNTFFCLDGDCYQGKEQKNTGFNHSASALAGLGSAAASLKQDPFQVFTGKPAFCSKKPLGISDCCADKGWGQGLGLTQCSEEEKGLAQAKQKGLTIDLGQFCAEKVLGVCIRKKKGYCQFDSKMARIVQQQGRPQLGINFGQAKSPHCQGLSPEQMQQLNFSTINFNEFYEDLHNNINVPDTNEVQRRIESKYKDLGEKQS